MSQQETVPRPKGRRWKKILAISLACVVLLVLAAGVGLWFFLKDIGNRQTDDQVNKQYGTPAYQGKRALDFAPFSAALSDISPQQQEAVDTKLLGADVHRIQGMLRDGQLTSEQLVCYYLKRIQQYDVDRLNSVLTLNPDAVRLARDADSQRRSGTSVGPLLGIPVLLKDNIGTGDRMPTTAGAKALADAHADRDAFLVQRLRAAGAVVLGKTNLSEWAYYMDDNAPSGFSVLGGQTRNPYGKFDVGGSSSGSASAAAANLATVTVGTETTGSLIHPASQNSVFALKPSLGLISRDRIIPISDALDSAGPMARHMTDLAVLLNALRGADPNDPASDATRQLAETDFTTFLDRNALNGLRVGVIRKNGLLDFGNRDGDDAILDRTAHQFRDAGAEVKDVTLDRGSVDASTILAYGYKQGVNKYLQDTGGKVRSVQEIIDFNQQDPANRAPWGQQLLTDAQATTTDEATYRQKVDEAQRTTREAIDSALRSNNVDVLVSLSNQASSQYANAGYPALSVPAGYRDSGEPLGMTLIGTHLDDGKLIKIGYAYEQKFGMRKDPQM